MVTSIKRRSKRSAQKKGNKSTSYKDQQAIENALFKVLKNLDTERTKTKTARLAYADAFLPCLVKIHLGTPLDILQRNSLVDIFGVSSEVTEIKNVTRQP